MARPPFAWALAALLAAAAGAGTAVARERFDDPDTEAARRHFARASEHYERQDYAAALREFEAARAVKPLPPFDFNIGRCYDRLERYPEAIEAYRRYLDAQPNAPDSAEVRARIEVLEKRVARPAPSPVVVSPPPVVASPPPAVAAPPPAPVEGAPPIYRRGLFWAVVAGVVAVAGVAIGLGVGLSSRSDAPPGTPGGDFRVMFP